MKLLFFSRKNPFTGQAYGGAESSMKLLAQAMQKRGHDVRYLVFGNDVTLLPRIDTQVYEGISVVSLREIKARWPRKYIRNLNERWRRWAIRSLIRKHKIELVYCYYERSVLEILSDVRRSLPRIKTVMRMAGLHWYESCQKNPSLTPRYKELFEDVDSVNFIHADLERVVREHFSELGEPDLRLRHTFVADIGTPVSQTVEPHGIPLELPGDDVFSIVMASRFSKTQKRQDLLIQAMSHIPKPHSVHLTLIGEGENQQVLEELAADTGVAKNVSVLPFQPQAALWTLLSKNQLLCHACEYEGLSKIVVESMGLGMPVLVSNVPVLNQYIVDGENGFLVENTPQAWAHRIVELMQEPAQLAQVGSKAVSFVQLHYDVDSNAEHFESVFLRLLKEENA